MTDTQSCFLTILAVIAAVSAIWSICSIPFALLVARVISFGATDDDTDPYFDRITEWHNETPTVADEAEMWLRERAS